MKVYIVEKCLYENAHVRGVYASLDTAKASLECEWHEDGKNEWDNGLDWDDSAHITEWNVE